MSLRKLQQQLEHTYEIASRHDVADFLITDPERLHALQPVNAREAPEKLFVRQDGGAVDVTLYLNAQMLSRLERDDPTRCLHDGNLADFCTVVEGISHFVYLVWNALHDRSVSLLELEMQAEVDKYITAALLLARQGRVSGGDALHHRLFNAVYYDPALNRDELHRYRRASHYADIYCRQLQLRFLRERREASMINELRRFYRLGQNAKINRIRAMR